MVLSKYSFAAWIATIILYICFLGWALLPESILRFLGITYYPSRYYALALPAYYLMTYAFIGITYIGLNLRNTLPPNDMDSVSDGTSFTRRGSTTFMRCGIKEGIPDFSDIHPSQLLVIYTGPKE